MLRTIAISLILVLSVGIMLPFTNSAHGVKQSVEIGQRRHHRYRSRAWWRRYRARMRQKRLAAELAHRNSMLSLPSNVSLGEVNGVAGPALPSLPASSAVTTTAVPPAMVSNASSAVRPRPNPAFLTSREEKKMLGGVAVGDLRRMVIDKMVSSGGWVVNDFMREVNGHRVFVITARTPKDALTPEKAWTFYFTEAGGRIYGLTTDAPVEFADRMTNEAERFIESLRAKAESSNR